MKIRVVLFILILFCPYANAAVFIVDNGAIESVDNTSWSGVDGEAYTTDTFPSGAKGYDSLEDIYNSGSGVAGLAAGDEIYLRGGTYSETYGTYASMQLPWAVDGTGWGDDERILFASYPGEWATIDGNGDNGCVLGYQYGGHTQATADAAVPEYWILERLGVTGSDVTTSSSGIGIHGGPWKIRYCYIYDNVSTALCSENAGGIRGYHWRDGSTIEYCYLKNNTAEDFGNCGQIINFSDYEYTRGDQDEATCRSDYVIRYNAFLFDEGAGYKDKGSQFLGDTHSDMTHKDIGPKVHHNLFLGGGSTCGGVSGSMGVEIDTDFAQVYNNIFEDACLMATLTRAGGTNEDRTTLWNTIYNNTIINAVLTKGIGDEEDPGDNMDFRTFMYNNIITEFGVDSYQPSIGFFTQACMEGYCDEAQADCTPNWTTSVIDRNLIHSPESAYHIGEPYSDSCCNATRWYSVSAFNTYQSVTNYTNSTANLFLDTTGADQYITDGDFVIGASTISAGGINASHPYLSGVTLPDYVGATDPDDISTNNWVDGLLNDLTSTTWLRSTSTDRDANDDPDWIAASEGSADTATMKGVCVNCN